MGVLVFVYDDKYKRKIYYLFSEYFRVYYVLGIVLDIEYIEENKIDKVLYDLDFNEGIKFVYIVYSYK